MSAFGFGGSNFHCVLEEAGAHAAAPDWDGDVQILAYSADDPREIAAALDAVATARDWAETRHLGVAEPVAVSRRPSLSLAHGRRPRQRRPGLTLRGGPRRGWKALRDVRRGSPRATMVEDARRFGPGRGGGRAARPGALAMLFPGQGSQYVGMLRGLACQFPRMRAALELMNEVCRRRRPLARRFDLPQNGLHRRRAARVGARIERYSDRAAGDWRAISLGLWRVLDDFGVRADLAGGHSFGELSALHAAGRIDDRSLLLLARRRGELLAQCAGADGQGAMLAVFAAVDEVTNLVRDHALDVVIANKNAPRQCVLSGPAGEIERCRLILGERNIPSQLLPVSAAFHSRAVAAAEGPLRTALDSIAFQPATIPVFANTTAEPYPGEADAARALLAGQVARPVEFVAQVEAMYRLGARTFLEVGPDTKLSALVDSILDGRDHVALAVDASRGKSSNQYDLACSLATLAALGYAVDLTRWDDAVKPRRPDRQERGAHGQGFGANARPRTPAHERAEGPRTPDGGARVRSLLAA